MENYDSAYSDTPALFGDDPERILVHHSGSIPRASTVLDVGCGQGRHSLWLARRGWTVHALDPSMVALAEVQSVASSEQLSIMTIGADFANHYLAGLRYGAVLVFGLIQILPPGAFADLRTAIDRWTGTDSLLFLTAWTTADPRYPEISQTWDNRGDGVFEHPDRGARRFLEPGELGRFFPGWDALHEWEGLGPWHRHGDSEAERHGIVEFVGRRRNRAEKMLS